MEIKCPKCRFRYNMVAAPGMTLLACVCPRCGMPFTFSMSEEDMKESTQASDVQEPTALDDDVRPSMKTSTTSQSPLFDASSVDVPPSNISKLATADMPIQPYLSSINPPHHVINRGTIPPGDNNKIQQHRWTCLRSCLLIFFLIILLIVFLIHACSRKNSYTSRNIENVPMIVNSDDGMAPTTSSSDDTSKDEFEEVHPEKAPEWIQGSWSVHTDYGPITITIKGNHIAETEDGETSYGTYYYQNHRLHCDFQHSSVMIFKLDEKKQRIDAGKGMLMDKIHD